MLKFIFLISLILLSTCGSPEKKAGKQSLSTKEQAIEVYKEGLKAIERSDYFFASKKFSEAEILLPQSQWAAKSALMVGYCFYSINFYENKQNQFLNHNTIITTSSALYHIHHRQQPYNFSPFFEFNNHTTK